MWTCVEVILWCRINHVLHNHSYQISPLYRGPGFSATMIPTLAVLTLIAYFQFDQGPLVLSIILSSQWLLLRQTPLFVPVYQRSISTYCTWIN